MLVPLKATRWPTELLLSASGEEVCRHPLVGGGRIGMWLLRGRMSVPARAPVTLCFLTGAAITVRLLLPCPALPCSSQNTLERMAVMILRGRVFTRKSHGCLTFRTSTIWMHFFILRQASIFDCLL